MEYQFDLTKNAHHTLGSQITKLPHKQRNKYD